LFGGIVVYSGKVVFSQVLEFLPLHVFRQCLDRCNGNYKVKEFTCPDHVSGEPMLYRSLPSGIAWQALQQRRVSRRSQRDRLRSGRHDYRFMLVPVPMGAFPKDERSEQAPYPIGSSRQDPVLHPHLRRKTPRGQHTGCHSHRSRFFLYHGGANWTTPGSIYLKEAP
jgi:hypothetical protein